MRFSFSVAEYNKAGEGKCWEMFHEGLGGQSPFCDLLLDHEGPHAGRGLVWLKSPQVDVEVARKFVQYCRRIPNHYHDIDLRDDGRVEMSMSAFRATTDFIGIRGGDD